MSDSIWMESELVVAAWKEADDVAGELAITVVNYERLIAAIRRWGDAVAASCVINTLRPFARAIDAQCREWTADEIAAAEVKEITGSFTQWDRVGRCDRTLDDHTSHYLSTTTEDERTRAAVRDALTKMASDMGRLSVRDGQYVEAWRDREFPA